MSDLVTVIDPAGNSHRHTPANANDLVFHAGWSFAGASQISAVAVAAAQQTSNPAQIDIVSPEGKVERHSFANAMDLINNSGWKRVGDEGADNSASASSDKVEYPPANMPDLVAFASFHELQIDEGLDNEGLRSSLISQYEAKHAPKQAASSSANAGDADLPPEGANRKVLAAFAEKHGLKFVFAPATKNTVLREDLITQFNAKAAA